MKTCGKCKHFQKIRNTDAGRCWVNVPFWVTQIESTPTWTTVLTSPDIVNRNEEAANKCDCFEPILSSKKRNCNK